MGQTTGWSRKPWCGPARVCLSPGSCARCTVARVTQSGSGTCRWSGDARRRRPLSWFLIGPDRIRGLSARLVSAPANRPARSPESATPPGSSSLVQPVPAALSCSARPCSSRPVPCLPLDPFFSPGSRMRSVGQGREARRFARWYQFDRGRSRAPRLSLHSKCRLELHGASLFHYELSFIE